MKPIRSNSQKENCSPISSNCVVWQGPDLPCISLCNGDSVSDVVYKLATDLCAIKDSTDISAVDFDCLLTECANTANPELTVAGILQLIIDNVCCSVTTLTGSINDLTGKTSNLYEEPILILPACLQYVDPVSGIPVTQLVLSQYVQKLAQEFCNLYSVVNVHTSQIANHETRITALEVAPCCYTPPTVTPNCSYGSLISGVPTQMSTMLQNLDFQFCNLTAVLGTTTQISNVSASQCPNLGSLNALSQIGTMSSLSGWNNTPSNLAQSLQNLWITVCDMRDAIISLKNCCAVDCSAFILGFTATEDSTRNIVTLIFNSYTSIPSGFSNCPLLSTVTITDGDGKTYTNTFDLLTESTDPTGIQFDTTTTGLNPSLPHTVTVSGCITKDGETCEKTVSYILPVPPTTTTTTTTVPPTTTTSTTTTSTTTTTTTTPPFGGYFEINFDDNGSGTYFSSFSLDNISPQFYFNENYTLPLSSPTYGLGVYLAEYPLGYAGGSITIDVTFENSFILTISDAGGGGAISSTTYPGTGSYVEVLPAITGSLIFAFTEPAL